MEKNILVEIAECTKIRVTEAKKQISPEQMQKMAVQAAEQLSPARQDFPFLRALRQEGLSFICEIKKASPSKGLIAPDFPYLEIAEAYEEAGAGAISVLTEPYYFQGSSAYLEEIRAKVEIPLLRKDFTVDAYQIYEARVLGADAVLLICAILNDEQLKMYLELAHSLGLSALVEAHDEEEVRRQ